MALFWRTKAGVKVDFVVYGERDFAAIEVKNVDILHPGDFTRQKSFGEDYPEATRLLLYRGSERFLRDGVWVVPAEEFLRSLVSGPLPPCKG